MADPTPPLWESFRVALRDRDSAAIASLGQELKKQKLDVALKLALEAFVAQAQGQSSQALQRLQSAAKHRKLGPHESLALGHLLLDANDAAGAQQAFGVAVAAKLKDPRLPAGQAAAALALGNIDEAHQHAERALQQDPRYAYPRYLLGLVGSAKGDVKAAWQIFTQVTQEDPAYLPAWLGYAAQAVALGKGAEAALALAPIAEAQPDHVGLRMALADCYRQGGELNRAIEILTPLASQTRDVGLLLDYAELCVFAGQLPVASATLNVLKELDPASARAHLLRGQVLEMQEPKDFEGAVTAYRQALSFAPDAPRVLTTLGLLLMRETPVKDWTEAQALLERAVQLESPPTVPSLLNLAILRAQQGAIEEAKALAQKVLARRPKDPSVLEQAQRLSEL